MIRRPRKHPKHRRWQYGVLLLTLVGGARGAEVNAVFAPELNLIGSYSQEQGWDGSHQMLPRNSLGFEHYATYANATGDFMRSDLQLRLAYDERDRTDATWAIELHNAWLRWPQGLGQALQVGHFSPAYGLEPVTDTHGALLQTLAGRDLGFKQDWGAAYSTIAGPMDLQAAGQLGSGMGIEHRDDSHLLSLRGGSPESSAVRWGLSLLYGRTLRSPDRRLLPTPRYAADAVRKRRLGADLRLPLGRLDAAAELTLGRDNSEDVLGALVELRAESLVQTRLGAALQARYWSNDPGNSRRTEALAAMVLDLPVVPTWTLRLGLSSQFESMTEQPLDRMVVLQLYHLGK